MPCAGCQRRRKKLIAAYHAVRHGVATVGHSYRAQMQKDPVIKESPQWNARDIARLKKSGQAPLVFNKSNIVDIRQ